MDFRYCLCRIAEAVVIVLVLTYNFAAQQGVNDVHDSSADFFAVRDGTPVTLCLLKTLSSASANVGDSVKFAVFSPVVTQELLLVRQGTVVSGTVLTVRHRGRFARDGEVVVSVEDLVLRDGGTVSWRRSVKSDRNTRKTALVEATVESIPTFGIALPMTALVKGEEKEYPAGRTLITMYINGPITINRRAWANLPYKGPPRIIFKNEGADSLHLFVGKDVIGELFDFLLVELQPGKYSFSTNRAGDPLQLDLSNDQQYWVESVNGALIADDSQNHADEIEKLLNDPTIAVRNMVETLK